MKFLLVYLNTAARNSFPIGVTSLLTYLKYMGHECEVFDTTFYQEFASSHRDNIMVKLGIHKKIENPIPIERKTSNLSQDLIDKINSFKPDVIGFSLMTVHFEMSKDLSLVIKRNFPNLPIIWGGLHPTLVPEEVIAEPSVDMICVGEGELAMAELLGKLSENKPINNIKNIWVKENGEVVKNPMRDLVDLNSLPAPDWDFYDAQHIYSPLNGRMYRVGSVEFGRGCPYNCAYCSAQVLRNMTSRKEYFRRRDTDKLINDLKRLRDKHNIEMFYFLDESFLSMNTSSLKEFASRYKSEIGIPFYGMTHPLTVTDEKVALLKEMGCYLMTIGIEHGNEEFRKNMLNRVGTNKQYLNAFRIFKKHDIHVSGFAMIGLPHETREMVFETIDLVRECQPTTYGVSIFFPFIGSKLRKLCIDDKLFDPENEKRVFPLGKSVLNMPQFSAKEIEGLWKTFYLYTKIPREYFPLVEIAEGDNAIAELQLKLLVDYVANQLH